MVFLVEKTNILMTFKTSEALKYHVFSYATGLYKLQLSFRSY